MKPKAEFPDYYTCLGIRFGASLDEIKKNFRALAKELHPDNPETGSKTAFQKILKAYQILCSERDRKIYDYAYSNFINSQIESTRQSLLHKEWVNEVQNQNTYSIPHSRIVFAHSVTEYAKIGLMRKGYRMKDRRKWTGINYDVEIRIEPNEVSKILRANIPLTVRKLCPICLGSDIHCSSCGGNGSYKSSKNLIIDLLPDRWKNGQILELELSRYRPDKLTHFKKKKLKIKLSIL
ncbi:MAG: DnaJ domain-containing protein [Leptospiraceae bacterium]|nr:DnaJ domain-containing protein [Leptospiraceae bacterium]